MWSSKKQPKTYLNGKQSCHASCTLTLCLCTAELSDFPECTASESDGGDSEEEGTVAEGASAECEGKPRPKSQAAKEILYANTSYLWLSRVKIPLRVTL